MVGHQNHSRQWIRACAGGLARQRRLHDAAIYRHRNRIERCFNKLKHFRRFATRYDRRAIHFLAFIHLAAAMIWMR